MFKGPQVMSLAGNAAAAAASAAADAAPAARTLFLITSMLVECYAMGINPGAVW